MIEFRNVHATYDDQLPVLRDVSFTIDDGEFVAFVGTNGAGKSTTMRLMNGLLKPSQGTVLLNGTPTTELRASEIARKVGFLFQNPDRQICCNTVREELLFGFKAQGCSDEEAREKVDAMIEHFNFDADAEPFLLNRGTRQLLALASILVTEPEVLILDEPTTGLDYRECCKVMEVIERAHHKGTTVVMVCHDMEVVGDHAKRVIAMTNGQIVADGPTFEVLRDTNILHRTDLIAPQICEISMRLAQELPALSATPIAQANTLNEMRCAIEDALVAKGRDRTIVYDNTDAFVTERCALIKE